MYHEWIIIDTQFYEAHTRLIGIYFILFVVHSTYMTNVLYLQKVIMESPKSNAHLPR